MSIIPELASSQGRRDEEPNKILGTRLVETKDFQGIQEAAHHLTNPNRKIRIDCLGVLEQVGRLAPELLEEYVDDFLKLLSEKDNRLVWQAMINLAMIADRKPDRILGHRVEIIELVNKGTVITRDNGIKILASVGSTSPESNASVFPFLIDQLNTCRPKSVPQYSESIVVAVNDHNKAQFLNVLNERMNELSASQTKRVTKLIKSLG